MRAMMALGLIGLGLALSGCCGTRACAPPSPAVITTTPATAAELRAFLEQYASTNRFRLGAPSQITLTPDGGEVLFLRSGARQSTGSLYAWDVAKGQEREVLTAAALLGGGVETLSAEERARRERQRQSGRGITGFSLSRDGSRLLVPLSGRVFVVERADGRVREVVSQAGPAIDAKFSRDGTKVACVRNGEVYITDLGDMAERQITRGAGESVTHGLAEFVAQEEMDRSTGFWLSPDAGTLIYQRTDTAGMEVFRIGDPADPAKPFDEAPYPRAGGKNADVQLGLIPAAGGDTTWVKWDRETYPYVACVGWAKNAPPTLLVLNRPQTVMVLYAIDPATGNVTELLTERDAAWINLEGEGPRWLEGGQQFLWLTEQRGDEWCLELRARDGAMVRRITPEGFGLSGVLHVDEANGAVFVSASTEPTQTHVWRVPLDGSAPACLTQGAGRFTAAFAKESGAFVISGGTIDGPPAWRVFDAQGVEKGQIVTAGEALLITPNVELVTVGARQYRAAVIRPRAMKPATTYPVIVSAYAGPHSQVVNANQRGYGLHQWLAEQGFIVVSIDARGTPGRGRAWERAWKESPEGHGGKGNLIRIAVNDQAEALAALGRRYPEMDLTRVGVTGWSFGGYFAALSVMLRPDAFHAGVAGAPVTDWRDYDTCYTERYIGTPQENPEGYADSSGLTHAMKLSKPLLLIHGTADDNVYMTHSLKLAKALLDLGTPFEFVPLAGFTHMVAHPPTVVRVQERTLEFFKRHLGEPGAMRDTGL